MEFLQEKKVYRCTIAGCLSYFERPYRLAQHLHAHKNIRPFACKEPNCTKAYTSKSHLDRHINSVHKPHENDVVYSCPTCLKPFVNRQNLKRHMNTVHKDVFTCDICKVEFKRKTQLWAHMYEHTGIKAFSCEVCSKTFASLYLKHRHMRHHKTYNCDDCPMVFNHWSEYQEHKKTNHEKTEYICDECGKQFKTRNHILRHLKIHTQEHLSRTFPCPYDNCQRFYSRNSNLKQHILVKHMNIYFVCNVCNASLSTKAKLNYHLQLHYNATNPKVETPEKAEKPEKKKQKKPRKDEGTFKTSVALKLAGLARAPDDSDSSSPLPLNLTMTSELVEVDCDVII